MFESLSFVIRCALASVLFPCYVRHYQIGLHVLNNYNLLMLEGRNYKQLEVVWLGKTRTLYKNSCYVQQQNILPTQISCVYIPRI